MGGEWQLLRSELNHQWLKNEFIRHLRAFIQRLSMPDGDELRLVEFARADWPEFAARREQLADLLASAEDALSPRWLVQEQPLARCPPESRAWLEHLVHALWLARTPIRLRISEAQAALDGVLRRYAELDPVVQQASCEALRSVTRLFIAFESEVVRLSTSLSRLPDRVQAV